MQPAEYGSSGRTLAQIHALYAEECRPGQVLLYVYGHGDWGEWYGVACPDLASAVATGKAMIARHGLDDPDWIYDGTTVHERSPDVTLGPGWEERP